MHTPREESRLFETLVPLSIRGMKSFFECYADAAPREKAPRAGRPKPAGRGRKRGDRAARIW